MDVTQATTANTRGLLLKGYRRRQTSYPVSYSPENIHETPPLNRPRNHSRLARRGGVVRMRKDIYPEICSVIKERLREVRIPSPSASPWKARHELEAKQMS
ncbi:uncharacterized protein CDV56_107175 [Aspergillus thermomutatus]|uniref:Uncharacterized protein n=1 Tax=Aspergillus thermomutatus TaxID=41047 RepID=A0A397HT12_ASPTH|nr:uncharacterized protein CDV56_107175 [Aspergillus thermomutatus]RHZ64706.1 hypothetical protein CDV56_107175 [Aspergillus thermomutatus]